MCFFFLFGLKKGKEFNEVLSQMRNIHIKGRPAPRYSTKGRIGLSGPLYLPQAIFSVAIKWGGVINYGRGGGYNMGKWWV